LAAKGVDLGKVTMDFLAAKELTQFIPGIKTLIEQYPEKIKAPVDVAVNIYGDRCELTLAELPTPYSIFDLGSRRWSSMQRLS